MAESKSSMKILLIVVLCATSIILNAIALPLLDIAEALAQISRKLSSKAVQLKNELIKPQ